MCCLFAMCCLFTQCVVSGLNCPFLRWFDPLMCLKLVEIISGLLRRINALEEVDDFFEE
jgi:hypothetical protein